MLTDKSPEYWARQAPLGELEEQVRAIGAFDEAAAKLLDFIYVDRASHTLSRTHAGTREAALALANHLERVAHDSVRDQLEHLARPYFTRWRLLAELARRAAAQLDLPKQILGRRHVREILVHLERAGGRTTQSELTQIPNEGQRSVTLKLMERWGLVDRGGDSKPRWISITELGRHAIHDVPAVFSPPRVAKLPPRFAPATGQYAVRSRTLLVRGSL
jgi:hypothetical protein